MRNKISKKSGGEMKKQLARLTRRKKKEQPAVGFVLINVAPAYENTVHTKLAKVPEIVELYSLFGEYDLIAKIETKNFERLGSIIISKIRSIEGIIDTRTLTATRAIVEC